MCLAVPRRVLRVDGSRAEVEWDDGPLVVEAVGLPDLAPGEYVLVHAGLALERLSAAEAEEVLALQAVVAAPWEPATAEPADGAAG